MIIRVVAFIIACAFLTGMTLLNENSHVKDIVIEPKGVNKVELELIFVAGKLTLSGGASKLMEGKFIYQEKEPEILYDPLGKNGYLYMKQQNESSMKNRSVWEISLNEHIPMDIHIATGASEGKLDFGNIYLQKLFLESGVGDTDIFLNGNYQEGFDGWIHAGVGNTTVYLPENIGVIVNVKQDRGKLNANGFKKKKNNVFVNEAYGKANVTIDLEVTMGIGEVSLILTE